MKRVALSVLFVGVALTFMHPNLKAQDPGSGLPDGEGKALVVRMCTSCHGLEEVISKRETESGWAGIVSDMVVQGAEGTDQEQKLVAAYLGKYFGTSRIQR